MQINKNKIINSLLCCNNFKFPMNNSHYVTGKDIYLFSSLACIENTLTNLTCNINNICNNVKCNLRSKL